VTVVAGDAPADEARHATVMFADISGFTALSERLDPEEVTTIISACFERLESVVFAHGGIVDEYLGDCIKSVFGLSPATADPTAHAVTAALEIRAALYQFNRDYQLPLDLDIHIGLDTGRVIGLMLGSGDRADFSAVGHAARSAAHLEDVSERGDILVGESTYQATHADFDYQALPAIDVGPGLPTIQAYQLLGRKPKRRARRQSERRQATMVFAEVLGFEELATQIDTAQVAHLLNELFAMFGQAVVDQGGYVDKFMGDGVMALFGIPNAIEYAPRHAINAAIEIRHRFDRFVQEHRLPVHLGIHLGVNSGLVIAGTIGGRVKRSFTAMGDAVNLAARLKEAARPGRIYVGPETHRATRSDFEFRELEPLRLKGKSQPVPAYEVLTQETRAHATPAGYADRRVFSDLVGRAGEMAQIEAAIQRVLAGEGGILSLIGEPGMGKTRLMAEVHKATAALPLRCLQGRSLAIGHNLSFHPFTDLFRQWADIRESDDDAIALEKLEHAVADLMADQSGEVTPFIATLMGVQVTGVHAARIEGIEGEALEKLILKSLREWLHALARRQPLILIFEDLHWADLSSVSLIESLLPLAADSRVLFLLVMRPEFHETSAHIAARSRAEHGDRYSEITLSGLDAKSASALVGNLLGIEDMPAAVQAVIAEKAEGNPFYIEEVVRSLIDAGAVEFHGNGFRVTEKIHGVVIPSTIQDVIMTRVDRLDEEARQLLQIAAVVGRNFHQRVLFSVMAAEASEPSLDADLHYLKERQLIAERREGSNSTAARDAKEALAAEIEYVFQHALVQETIYNAILQKTRKELHDRVAQVIEAIFAERIEDFFGMLAYHYSRAEKLEKAEDYLFRAGEVAARSAASNEALNFFQEAARLYLLIHGDGGDPRRRALLEKNIGLALLGRGKLAESIDHFDRALELLGQHVPKNPIATYSRFATDLVAVLFRLYTGSRATTAPSDVDLEVFDILFNRARALTTTDPQRLFFDTTGGVRRLNRVDPTAVEQSCGMYAGYSLIFAFAGLSFAVSRRLIDAAESLVRPHQFRDAFVFQTMRFIHHLLEGNWDERYTIAPELLEQNLRAGQLWEVNTYLGLDCDRRLHRGDFAGARACLDKLDEMIHAYGYEFARPNYLGMKAMLLLEERRLGEALAAAQEYESVVDEDPLRVLALGCKGKIQILQGDLQSATATLAKAGEIVRRSGPIPPWHLANFVTANLLLALQEAKDGGSASTSRWPAATRPHLRRAMRIGAKVAGSRPEVYRLAGTASWAAGQPQRALRSWERGLDEAEALGAQPECARLHWEIGQSLRAMTSSTATCRGLDAAAHLERARHLFTDTGLENELRQLAESEGR